MGQDNMNRSAIIFAEDTPGSIDPFTVPLQKMQITALRPNELPDELSEISLIIINRPIWFAEKICENVRKLKALSNVPILVVLDSVERAKASQLAALRADVRVRPFAPQDLQKYLETEVPLRLVAQATSTQDKKASSKASSSAVGKTSHPVTQQNNGQVFLMYDPPEKDKAAANQDADRETNSEAKATKVLADLPLPSKRLLPKVTKQVQVVKGAATECPRCHRWKARTEDIFCSRCGTALVSLSVLPETVIFEPLDGRSVEQLVDLRNGGQNPLHMTFGIRADQQLAQRFSLHTTEAVLEGKPPQQLSITFDPRELDLTKRYDAVLEINSNEKDSSRQVNLIVERLAIPKVMTAAHYVFAVNADNSLEFRLTNDGGGTLKLNSVRLNSSKGQVDGPQLELTAPVEVKGGQTATVRVRVPKLNLGTGEYERTLALHFARMEAPILAEIKISVTNPPQLLINPLELDFRVVSAKRFKRLSLIFINQGDGNLTIHSITPSVSWLKCLVKEFPLRIPLRDSHFVDFQVDGSDKLVGKHRGEVTVCSDSFQHEELTIPFTVEFVEPEEYPHYIGIDFGTTASCVAILDNDEPSLIALDSDPTDQQADARIMPSVLFFQPDGTVQAGRKALDYSRISPANAVTSIKRALGLKHKEVFAGQEFDATQLTAKIIQQLIWRTEDGLFERGQFETPRRAVITAPVGFLDRQRHAALVEACRVAGLETVDSASSASGGMVINEAHAVALYYLNKKVQAQGSAAGGDLETERVLVFDFGGGTLDCELIEIVRTKAKVIFKTLAVDGDPRLGGEDIDWALADLLADKVHRKYPTFDRHCLSEEHLEHRYSKTLVPAHVTRAEFKRNAEQAKKDLCKSATVNLSLRNFLRIGATPDDPFVKEGAKIAQFEVALRREEFEHSLEPYLRRAEEVVRRTCRRAGIEPHEIQTVLHAGRTSLIPSVRNRIGEILKATDRTDLIGTKLCVALGAAFWGRIKDRPRANIEFIGVPNQVIHDIGYIDFDPSLFKDVFVPVFPAGTAYGNEVTVEFERPGDKSLLNVELAISRNSGHSSLGNVRANLNEITTPRVPVRFIIDENGIIKVVINNQEKVIERDE